MKDYEEKRHIMREKIFGRIKKTAFKGKVGEIFVDFNSVAK